MRSELMTRKRRTAALAVCMLAAAMLTLPMPMAIAVGRDGIAAEAATEPPQDTTQTPPLAIWRQWRHPALQTLLEEAHRNSPTLTQAEARLREARAQSRQATAERKPAIDLTAGAQRSRLNDRERALDSTGARYASQSDLGLSWRWNLDLFGATAAQRDAARWRTQTEAVAFEAARNALSAEVARQYVLIRSGDVQQQRERALIELLREQEVIDAALEEAGLLAAQDRFALRAEREAREASLRDVQIGRRRAVLAMRALGAGETDAIERALIMQESMLQQSEFQQSMPTPGPQPPGALSYCSMPLPEHWPVSALARRHDLRIAEYGMLAASADARAARRARWPALNLSGRGGWVGSEIGDLVRPSNLGAQLLASLGVSLLDFGRLKAQLQAAQAREDAARAQYAQAVLRAAEDVDTALLTIEQARHVADRSMRARTEGDAVVGVAHARWRAGLDSRRQAIATERKALERAIVESAAEQRMCEAKIGLSLALALPEYEADVAMTGGEQGALR
jgi:outer membrane protein TolC